jgi:hypothetical protein
MSKLAIGCAEFHKVTTAVAPIAALGSLVPAAP